MENPDGTLHQPIKPLSFRIPGWLAGLLLIGCLTFVFGFYQPAARTADKHAEHFKQLSSEYKTAVQGYQAKNKELSDAQHVTEKQKSELDQISAAESSQRGALSELYVEVKDSLETLIQAKVVSVDQGADAVSVSIEGSFLIYPYKTFVHARGEQHLCAIAKSIPKQASGATEVVAHANGQKPGSRIVEKQFPNSWLLSGALAAEVAEKIQACGIAGTELRAIGTAHYEGEAKLARKSPARFEIVIYPSATK